MNAAPMPRPPYLRIVRPVPEPLGLYFRVSRFDQSDLLQLIASGEAGCSGIVLDPLLIKPHAELRDEALKRGLDIILDPRTLQSALRGGFNDSLGKLPWGVRRMHVQADFERDPGNARIASLGRFAIENEFTQIIAPTHLLPSVDDKWLPLDVESTLRLREFLDSHGAAQIQIVYSLAVPYSVVRDHSQIRLIAEQLNSVPASSIWLRVDGLGSDSTATGVLNYIDAAAQFHQLRKPVIADNVGGLVGLGLLAFGAVGGLSHGVTFGETFSTAAWRREPKKGPGFGLKQRVYVRNLDLMLTQEQAETLLRLTPRARGRFGCADTNCCPRGVTDMIESPGHHFLYQRVQQVLALSRIPEQLRLQKFLDDYLRPTTDDALLAANSRWRDATMLEKMQNNRKRLDRLRYALGKRAAANPPQTYALPPKRRIVRQALA